MVGIWIARYFFSKFLEFSCFYMVGIWITRNFASKFLEFSCFNMAGIWRPGMMDDSVTWDYFPHSRRASKSKFGAFIIGMGEVEQ